MILLNINVLFYISIGSYDEALAKKELFESSESETATNYLSALQRGEKPKRKRNPLPAYVNERDSEEEVVLERLSNPPANLLKRSIANNKTKKCLPVVFSSENGI